MRLPGAACANEAPSTAVARRDGRSHKRSGGTSTRPFAPVSVEPSVGAIGVGHPWVLIRMLCIGATTTILHLVGDSHERCARAGRQDCAVRDARPQCHATRSRFPPLCAPTPPHWRRGINRSTASASQAASARSSPRRVSDTSPQGPAHRIRTAERPWSAPVCGRRKPSDGRFAAGASRSPAQTEARGHSERELRFALQPELE